MADKCQRGLTDLSKYYSNSQNNHTSLANTIIKQIYTCKETNILLHYFVLINTKALT